MTTMFPARTRAPGVRESTPEAPLVAAVDGSPASLAAVEEAISLAPELDAPLVFAYVRRRPRGYLGAPYYQRQLTGAMARARRTLDRARGIAASAGRRGRGRDLGGEPEPEDRRVRPRPRRTDGHRRLPSAPPQP
jgi:nucleotide-binding universal stress UspA family protein